MADSDALKTSGGTVWFTGLPGAGKSTVAQALHNLLGERGLPSYLLDGDDLREGLNADLSYHEADRIENVRRLGEVAVLFARFRLLSLVSAISPYAAGRKAVRERHLAVPVPFVEIYVATPLEVCEARDPKGLYARARRGELASFTGVSHPYEKPVTPELVLTTMGTPEQAAREVFSVLEAVTLFD
jgi:bifunctional enzyme CysN/CysC